jgi:ABC-type sulfate/molybdate transport systems ATPase subunit
MELAREERGDGFWATLRHVNVAGAVVKLELEDGESHIIHVEATRQSYEALRPTPGERLFVRPREMHIFLSPESHPAP